MSKLEFGEKMESFTQEQLRERIRYAMDYKIKNQITLMPYLGELKETVEYQYKELVALCPVTGILDLYTITIQIKPDKFIPELKSLKMYYLGYKDLPIGHEHIAAKIFKEFKQLVKPKEMRLVLDVAIRGGIKTQVKLETDNFWRT